MKIKTLLRQHYTQLPLILGSLLSVNLILFSTNIASAAAPTVVTQGYVNLSQSETNLYAEITTTNKAVSQRGFQYGTTTNYGNELSSNVAPTWSYNLQWGRNPISNGEFYSPSGIDIDNSGNLFVVDKNNHRIQKFDNNGNFLSKWGNAQGAYGGTGDGDFSFPKDVSIDNDGNVYIVDSYNHRIQKFDNNGNFLTKWGSQGSSDGQFDYPAGIGSDLNGNIYVSDSGNHRIQKFDSNGNFLSKWGSQGSSDGNFNAPTAIDFDSFNNVYIVDTNNNRIQKFDSSGNFLTKWGSYGSSDGEIIYPVGISVDSSGNVYVADTFNNRIQKFDNNGNFLAKWGSGGGDNGQFNVVSSIVVDLTGNVIVADTLNNRIQKLNSNGGFISKIGADNTSDGKFNGLNAISSDNSGNVYVADTFNNRIQKFDSSGNFLTKWGSYGSSDGQFYYPEGISVDTLGNVYVADTYNHRIQKFDSNGNYLTEFGSQSCNWQGPIIDGDFCYPYAIAIDNTNNIYIVDNNNNRIQKFDSAGNFLTKWGSNGTGDGQFASPQGISVDSSGDVYVVDTYNHRIQKFDSAGNFITKWGSQGNGFGQFFSPHGISTDEQSNVYISDEVNRVQIFDSDGNYLSNIGFGYAGGQEGQFYNPKGLRIDTQNNLYVADSSNNRIQKFSVDQNGGTGTYFLKADNLTCGMTYHYRAFAINEDGTSFGNDATFIAAACPIPPIISTGEAYSIRNDSSDIYAYVIDQGGSSLSNVGIEYGLDTNYGSFANNWYGFVGSNTVSLSGLTCGTTYHYRAYATNAYGTTVGDDATFTTSACPTLPAVTTGDADPVNNEGTSTEVGYTVTDDGSQSPSSSGIEYGLDTNYGTTQSGNYYGVNQTSYANLYNLTCDTTYHYRAYATNSAGTAYGEDKTFSLPCPVPYDLSLSGYRVTPKPVTAGQDIQYKLTATNNGPGTVPVDDDGFAFYINIPTSTQFIDVGVTNGYEAECQDIGDISQLAEEDGDIWAGYTGNLVICEVYSSNETDLTPGDSYNITIDLLATQDMQQGQDVLRALVFTGKGNDTESDTDTIEQALEAGIRAYDIPINNIINLTYGINDEQQANSDGDSIPDATENAAPNNGDANNDGTPDAQQTHVTSFVNPATKNYITLVAPNGLTISTATALTAAQAALSDGLEYPLGFTAFTITGLDTGQTIPFTMYTYTNRYTAIDVTARKYLANKAVFNIDNVDLSNQTIGGQKAIKASYSLTDGGELDQDNRANGSIVDPIGLAKTSGLLANTGTVTVFGMITGLIMITGALYTFRDYRKHKAPLEAIDPKLAQSYTYWHHLRIVTIPLVRYRLRIVVEEKQSQSSLPLS